MEYQWIYIPDICVREIPELNGGLTVGTINHKWGIFDCHV